MSRSRRSFTVQPAPLRSTAPQPNKASILMSGRFPGVAARVIDLDVVAVKSFLGLT